MNKEDYKLKNSLIRRYNRELLQRSEIAKWEFLESLHWDEPLVRLSWEEWEKEEDKLDKILENEAEKQENLLKTFYGIKEGEIKNETLEVFIKEIEVKKLKIKYNNLYKM